MADRARAGDDRLLAGRYRLEDVLGHGGMAVVYRAVDQRLQRPVAVKVLHGRTHEASDRARFTAEARTLAGLSHSGLVVVLDAGLAGDHAEQPFLVMELVPGETLAARLGRGALGVDRAGSVGVQLAEALAYAHARGVVHRDVKPANVLLGDGERVKLADFGIARLVGDAARHTQTGAMIGTAAYLSPEQVRGEDATSASDVYALGLVLLEALTGRREYPGTATEAAFARLHRRPEVPGHLSDTWRRVLTQMTADDPAERPPAEVVARTLRTEPTGPIPAAVVDHVPVTAVVPAATGGDPAAASVATPLPDRVGDALARHGHGLWRRLQELDSGERGVALAVLALLLFLLVVGLAA